MTPRRGEIWIVDFSPSVGSEIRAPHPALVVSANDLNQSPWGLVIVCPITTLRKEKPFRLHIIIAPPEGGVKHRSVIRLDQIKSVSMERFSAKWGSVAPGTMRQAEYILRRVLDLPMA